MFIKSAIMKQNMDAVEVKYLTAFHLSNCGRTRQSEELLVQSYADLTMEIKSFYQKHNGKILSEIGAQVCKRYFTSKYFNNPEDADSYNRYLVSYCLNNKKLDLATGYLDTELGEKFIRSAVEKEFSGSGRLSPDKINLILRKFREVTRKQYAESFRNEGNVAKYLGHAFKSYFIKNYSTEITSIINAGSMTIGEGKEIKDMNQIKNDSIQEVKINFDMPNFQEIVRDVYAASSCLQYKLVDLPVLDENGDYVYDERGRVKTSSNPWGIIYYDVFSHLKKQIFEDRFASLKNNPEYSKVLFSNVGTKFTEVDINAEVYADPSDKNTFNYRNYTTRGKLIDLVVEHLGVESDIEFFRDVVVYNDIEGGVKKNNTKVFDKAPGKLNVNIHKCRIIKKGIKSAKAFIETLKRHNVDPLGIPSDIFKDPAWMQRATTLEEYLNLYKNVTSLESVDTGYSEVSVLQHNKMLTRVIAYQSKDEISQINCADLKDALKNPKRIEPSEIRFEPIGEDYSLYTRYREECRRLVDEVDNKLDTLKKLAIVIKYFAKKRGIDDNDNYFTKLYTSLTPEKLEAYDSLRLDIAEAKSAYMAMSSGEAYDWTQMKRASSFGFQGFMEHPPSEFNEEQLNQIYQQMSYILLNFLKRFVNTQVYEDAKHLLAEFAKKNFVDWRTMDLDVYGLGKYQNAKSSDIPGEEFKEFYLTLCERAEDLVRDHELVMNFQDEVDRTSYMDWQIRPENFDSFINEIADHAKETGNSRLWSLLIDAVAIMQDPTFSSDSVYESYLTAIRCLSVVSFIGHKLVIIFESLTNRNINDLVFLDTMNVAKPLLEAMKGHVEFEKIIDFDSIEVARKYHALTRDFPSEYSGVDWLTPFNVWLSQHPFEYIGKEIQMCESKANVYNKFNTARRMQRGCDLAERYFRKYIDFLVLRCLPVVERENVELHSDALLMGKHKETMLSYASYIRVYPHLTKRIVSLNGGYDSSKSGYSLFENEYVMINGKLLTERFEGRIYYVHKSGVSITPELNINDSKCIMKHPINS